MFTGITQELLTIITIEEQTEPRLIRVTLSLPKTQTYAIGDSIMLSGVCSTVVEIGNNLVVEYIEETLQKTTVTSWQVGDKVNCESPATLETKLSGSLVVGHVDCAGEVIGFEQSSNHTVLTVSFSANFAKYVVPKGSITFNGVNLTIVDRTDTSASVHLIPHTLEITNLQYLTVGQQANIEFDYIAKVLTHAAQYT